MNEAAGSGPERKTKRQLQEVAIFNDVAKALTSSLNLDSILQTIMDKMAEFFRPDTWSLLMVDEQKDELYFAIAVGDAAETLKTVRLKVGEGIAGWVARHGESLIVPDVYNDPRFSKRIDEMTKWKTRSIICVPLQSKHRVLGVIQLINCAMESFGEQEMFFLHALCDYAAIAIDNARAVEKIQELTITDDCTGLYNARHLYKTLETEVYRSSRFGYEFSVLFIDLDRFKVVNDTHGHLVGSRLLAEIGGLLKRCLGPNNAAFRYGGDEFVALLAGMGKSAASGTTMALREDLRAARFLEGAGLSLNVSGSFGLATYPEDGNSVPTILRAADTMMYEAKITRDSVAVSGKGTVSKAAKSAADSGPRQAVAGLFLERDGVPRG